MERRFLLFLLLSFLLLTANSLWNAPRGDDPAAKPPAADAQPAGDEVAGNDAEDDDAEAVNEAPPDAPSLPDQQAADDEPDEGVADAQPADENENAPEPLQYVTLGSANPDSPYRMLVTLTNQGAAVRRLELSNSRYQDVQDRGGYLGHLELAEEGGKGLVVQVVGAGTPAAAAGLKPGDRLLQAGAKQLRPVKSPADLATLLAKAKPRRDFKLQISRNGKTREVSATLTRRPLEVIRPESENVLMRLDKLPPDFVEPPSFLMTLGEIDDRKIAEGAEELTGVELREANWKLVAGPDAGKDSATFERRVPKLGLVVTKTYRLDKAAAPVKASDAAADPAYDLTLEITIRNDAGDKPHTVAYRLDGPNGLPIEGWWYATKIGREWSAAGLRDVIGRYVGGEPHQQGASAIAADKVEDFESAAPLAYMGVDAQYFSVALIPQPKKADDAWIPLARSIQVGPQPDGRGSEPRFANVTFRLFSKPLPIEPGQEITHRYQIFAGPKRPELLREYQYAENPAYSLNDFVYYGWFGAVARGMVGLLHVFYGIVGNYGLAIIMLTVLVRGAMFPLSRGQAKSMAKMQELRPEMDRIKERYKGDQQKQAQAMQQLYRKHGVNPLAGCLPMLIQLPIFIGLYRGLAVDVELRGAPLFSESIQWCSNLAAPDMLWDWSGVMPDFINRGDGIFSLGPYLNVLPLVTIVLWILQQKMFMPEPANEQAAMQQKIMKYMMIFMAVLFYKVPSGLCLYFIASSVWGIAERKIAPPPTAAPGAGSAAGPSGDSPKRPRSPASPSNKDQRRRDKSRTKPKRRP